MDLTRVLLTAFITASAVAVAVSCAKSETYLRTENETVVTHEQATAVSFSTYYPGMATKAVSYNGDDILGHWVDSISTYVPGTGIGVFAFYQKAKSNGYPTNFNKNTGEPTFMYNQKLERTSSDGISYTFDYSPRKYWPNNTNDQLSFFAYAPYDVTTAWEDLQMVTTLKGDRVWKHYELEGSTEDQTDFIWADPVLNKTKPNTTETIDFELRHICAKLGVTCQINIDDDNNFITIDKVVIRAKFNASGDYVYRTAADSSAWENLERSYHTKDYLQFRASSTTEHRVRTTRTRVGGDDGYLFPFPGTQDITLTATLSHNIPVNIGTPEEETRRFSSDVTWTFTSVELKEGKSYDFLLSITLDPIDIGAVAVTEWSIDTVDYPIP